MSQAMPMLDMTLASWVRTVWLSSTTNLITYKTPGALIRSLPVAGALPALTRAAGYYRYIPAQYQRYFIDLRIGFVDYQRQFSPKTRSTIKRKVKP